MHATKKKWWHKQLTNIQEKRLQLSPPNKSSGDGGNVRERSLKVYVDDSLHAAREMQAFDVHHCVISNPMYVPDYKRA